MPNSNAFKPIIKDTATTGAKTQVCVQATTGAASASLVIKGNEVLVKALTNTAYIRLGRTDSAAVSATNGYYMAVGDEVRWQTSEGADRLFYIQGAGAGALSIAFGSGD